MFETKMNDRNRARILIGFPFSLHMTSIDKGTNLMETAVSMEFRVPLTYVLEYRYHRRASVNYEAGMSK